MDREANDLTNVRVEGHQVSSRKDDVSKEIGWASTALVTVPCILGA